MFLGRVYAGYTGLLGISLVKHGSHPGGDACIQVAWVTRSGTSQLAKPVKESQCIYGGKRGFGGWGRVFFFWKKNEKSEGFHNGSFFLTESRRENRRFFFLFSLVNDPGNLKLFADFSGNESRG